MEEYECKCGLKFNSLDYLKKHHASKHHASFVTYKIFKKTRKERWLDRLFGVLLKINIRWIGFFIAYIVLINHFSNQFNFIEVLLIGFGMGLYIE